MHFNSSLFFAFLASCLVADVINAQAVSSVASGASSLASQVSAGATSLASDTGNAATSLGGAASSTLASATGSPTPTAMPSYPGGAWPTGGNAPGASPTGLPLPSQSGSVTSSAPAFGLVATLAIAIAGVLQE